MKKRFSRYVPMSLPRVWMRDIAYFGSRPPVVGGSLLLRVAPLVEARRNRQPLISWGAILTKAIALTARRHPELKRSFMPLPWAHFYEHPHSLAAVAIERQWRGEPAVFFHKINAPEEKSLQEIDHFLRTSKKAPVESIGSFRRLIRISRFPWPLRGLLWRLALYGSGRLRSRHIGTFLVNSVPARRGFTTQSLTPLSFSFFYGPVGADGDWPIQMFFDHRVLDGTSAALLIVELNAILCGEIVAELSAAPEHAPAVPMPDTAGGAELW